MITTEIPAEVRDRMVLGLDVGELAEAEAMAARVAPWFGVAKVGPELYAAAGPEAIDRHARARLRGLRRPQAARHPDHRRARGARARASRSATSELPRRRRRRRCCARASQALAEGAATSAVTAAGADRGDGAHDGSGRERVRRASRGRARRRGATVSCAACTKRRVRGAVGLRAIVPGLRFAG